MNGDDLQQLLGELGDARFCTNPVRLHRLDPAGGPGRTVTVACKDRRAAVCSRVYKGDAWHLVAAGLEGGKGLPATVAHHPRLFVTLTAPSFGSVHHVRPDGGCHPDGGGRQCGHGRCVGCPERHAEGDPRLGEPLCPACFDYPGAVLWNAHASKLWQATTLAVRRRLAEHAGIPRRALPDLARLSFAKVVEFQRRGLVHLHAVVRLDGPDGPTSPPPAGWDTPLVARAVADAASVTVASTAGGRVGWGPQRAVVLLDHEEGSLAVAAYVAKYATKTSDDDGALAHRLRSLRELHGLKLRPHQETLVRSAWRLAGRPEHASLRLQLHAHTYGYPGHHLTKSRRYSTTFGALRRARTAEALDRLETDAREDDAGPWLYAGRGYRHPDAAFYLDALEAAAAGFGGSPAFPAGSTVGSPGRPHRC